MPTSRLQGISTVTGVTDDEREAMLRGVWGYLRRNVMGIGVENRSKFSQRTPGSEGLYRGRDEFQMGEIDPPGSKLGRRGLKEVERYAKIAIRSEKGTIKVVDHTKGGHIEAIDQLPLSEQAVGKKIEDGMITTEGRFVPRPKDAEGWDIDGVELIGKRVDDFGPKVSGYKVRTDAVMEQGGDYGTWHGFTFLEGPAEGASFTVVKKSGTPTAEDIRKAGQEILKQRK